MQPSVYVASVLDLLAGQDERHARWLEHLDEERQGERLANAAAVYRWHLHHVRLRLAALEPPTELRAWRDAALTALEGAGDAAATVSHGYRFHNVARICDGLVALDAALHDLGEVRDAAARWLSTAITPEGNQPPAA